MAVDRSKLTPNNRAAIGPSTMQHLFNNYKPSTSLTVAVFILDRSNAKWLHYRATGTILLVFSISVVFKRCLAKS